MMRGVWRDAEVVDPTMHNNKLATYHSWFALPFPNHIHMPITVPRYLHLDLPRHVLRNVSRFRLRAHTLRLEAAAWLKGSSQVCDKCPDDKVQNEVHAFLYCQNRPVCELRKNSYLFTPFFEDFSVTQPFMLHQVSNQLVFDFLSQQNTKLFLSISDLMDFLWLAGTSQQPIS